MSILGRSSEKEQESKKRSLELLEAISGELAVMSSNEVILIKNYDGTFDIVARQKLTPEQISDLRRGVPPEGLTVFVLGDT